MKEKITKILESQFSVVEYEDPDTGFTESTTIDVLTTDEFPDIVDKLEILVNQEVERRIAERMPSPSDKLKGLREYQFNIRGRHEKDYITEDFLEGVEWLRSRLTPQVTPQDTPQVEKTECGYYTSEGRCLPGCMTDSCKHHPNNR